MADKLAKAEERIKQLEEAAKVAGQAGAPAPDGGAAAGAPWREASPEKERLAAVDKRLLGLQVFGEDECVKPLRAQLEAEQAQLRKALFEAKPKDAQLRSWSDRIKKQEKQLEKGREELAALELQQQELAAKAEELRASITEKEASIARLKREQAESMGRVPSPPSEPGAGLDGLVGGTQITAEILGQLLGNFAVEQSLLDQVLVQANAAEQRQQARAKAAQEEAAAAARRAEEGAAPAQAPAAARAAGAAAAARTGAADVTAGDEAMDDEELSVDEQLDKLRQLDQAPAPGAGEDRPSDDAVRAAFKRCCDIMGFGAKRARHA